MSKFRVGDKVRCVENDWPQEAGAVHTVSELIRAGVHSAFKIEGSIYVFLDNRWELVEPVTAPSTPSYEPPPGLLGYIARQLGSSITPETRHALQVVLRHYNLRPTVEFVKEAA